MKKDRSEIKVKAERKCNNRHCTGMGIIHESSDKGEPHAAVRAPCSRAELDLTNDSVA